MTPDGGGVYSYLYQSLVAGVAGQYVAYITAVSGDYTGLSFKTFDLK